MQALPRFEDEPAMQRPVLALMGEFSAGKSTLLNMLMAQALMPTHITATQLPVVWLRHGAATTWQGIAPDGQVSAPQPGLPDWAALDHLSMVRITLDHPLLLQCDVIDTPGISDPRVSTALLGQVADHADLCLWCSAANQAWRQTEKAAWSALPRRLRQTSILAVTRADQLVQISDLARVVKRLKTEAGDLFGAIIPISAHQGMAAIKDGQLHDPQLWADSGAKALQQQIRTFLQLARATPRPAITSAAPHSIPTPGDMPSPPTQSKEKQMAIDISGVADIGGFIGACLVDSETGLMMASEGGEGFDLEAAGAANTDVVKAKLAAIKMLGLDDHIDDILITLGKQFHLIRPLADTPTVFLYVALDKKAANLGMARVQVKKVEQTLSL
jgi:hypothetical protein